MYNLGMLQIALVFFITTLFQYITEFTTQYCIAVQASIRNTLSSNGFFFQSLVGTLLIRVLLIHWIKVVWEAVTKKFPTFLSCYARKVGP